MHLCLFYTQPDDLWEQCQTQIAKAGPTACWLYVADEHPAETVHQQIQTDTHGEVIDSTATTFRASPVRIPALITSLTQQIEHRLTKASTILLFVEMSWALRTPSGAVYLREYEAEIERLTNHFPLTAICLYNQKTMLDRQLMIGMHTHRKLLIGGEIVDNPHFVPPNIFSKRNLRRQFEYWLHDLTPSAAKSTGHPVEKMTESYSVDAEPSLIAHTSEEGRWKIRCFGGLRVYRSDGALIQWNIISGATRKTKVLFAFLLFRGERGATVEEITDLLWPNADGHKQSINRLHHTIRCLRKALSPNLVDSKQSPFVLRQDQRYFLALPPHSWLDLPMFQELCYRSSLLMREHNWDEAILVQESARGLYTGDLLADIQDKYAANRDIDWCWSQRYWYREMYVKLLANSAEVYRHTQRISEALQLCDKALQHDPINELAHQEKMRILAAVNRRDALHRQYRLYKDALKQFDMGVPSSEFERFFKSLKIADSYTSKIQS